MTTNASYYYTRSGVYELRDDPSEWINTKHVKSLIHNKIIKPCFIDLDFIVIDRSERFNENRSIGQSTLVMLLQ